MMRDASPDGQIEVNKVNGSNGTSSFYSLPIVQPPNLEEDEESLDLRQLATVIKHRFRLIVTVTLGVATSVTLWTLNQESIYRGSFQVLIEPVNQEQKQHKLDFLVGNWEGVDYESQIEVLRSPSVLNPLVKKLSTLYPEIEYEQLIQPKNSPLKIEQLEATKILNISYQDSNPKKIQFVLKNLAQAYLDYSLAEKRKVIEQGIEFVGEQLPELTGRVAELQGKLEKFRQKHNLLDPDAHSLLIAEQLTQAKQQHFETLVNIKENKSLYDDLHSELGLEPEQALVTSYLSESPNYQNLLAQLQEVEVNLAQESARFLPNSPIIIELKENKAELLVLLEKEAAKILGRNLAGAIDNSANSPSVSSPSSLRLELNLQYIEAANKTATLELRRQSLEEKIANLNQLTRQMPVIARQYTDLTRELAVANESLNRFLQAEEELQIEVAQQSIPWEIIAQPVIEEDPIFPQPPRDIVLGLIGGTFLGLAAALLAERLDPVFHSTEELKEMTNLPLLGIVPLQKNLESIALASAEAKASLPQLQIGHQNLNLQASSPNSPHSSHRTNRYHASPFLEAFRSLNTNVKLLGSDSLINSLVVSSSIPSEGKSTIAFHLAQAAAAMGQRVLLIDADLRRPQAHRWAGLKNTEGLSNILATNLAVEAAIKKITQWENLFVITAGDVPPDPTRLLSSQKMRDLMEKLKHSYQYDLIIYDTPPILGFADGRIVAAHTNGVVLVVKMGKTDRSLLKQNIDNLKMANIPVLGLVANQVNRHSNGSSYYYSHYYADRK